jgi:hypothetical protein
MVWLTLTPTGDSHGYYNFFCRRSLRLEQVAKDNNWNYFTRVNIKNTGQVPSMAQTTDWLSTAGGAANSQLLRPTIGETRQPHHTIIDIVM